MTTALKSRLKTGLEELGVDQLLSNLSTPSAEAMSQGNAMLNPDQVQTLPIHQIVANPEQPRKQFSMERLCELAESIKKDGVLQPILVKPMDEHQYQIIAGERRWRAADIAGLETIPAFIRSNLDEKTCNIVALIENLQREDLNPVEQSHALVQLQNQYGLTQEALAARVNKSRSQVANLVRIASKLNIQVQDWLAQGAIEMGHAKILMGVPDKEQKALAQLIIDRGLTVRATEVYLQRALAQRHVASLPPNPLKNNDLSNSQLDQLTQALEDHLHTDIKIKHNSSKGRGRLVIHYKNANQLKKLMRRMGSNVNDIVK